MPSSGSETPALSLLQARTGRKRREAQPPPFRRKFGLLQCGPRARARNVPGRLQSTDSVLPPRLQDFARLPSVIRQRKADHTEHRHLAHQWFVLLWSFVQIQCTSPAQAQSAPNGKAVRDSVALDVRWRPCSWARRIGFTTGRPFIHMPSKAAANCSASSESGSPRSPAISASRTASLTRW